MGEGHGYGRGGLPFITWVTERGVWQFSSQLRSRWIRCRDTHETESSRRHSSHTREFLYLSTVLTTSQPETIGIRSSNPNTPSFHNRQAQTKQRAQRGILELLPDSRGG